MAFEHAFAVVKFASGVADFANGRAVRTIEEAHGFDELVDRVAVGPGIAVDRASHPSRDAGHGVQALRVRLRWSSPPGPGARRPPRPRTSDAPVDFDALGRVAQDHAGKSAIVRDQVGPAPYQRMRGYPSPHPELRSTRLPTRRPPESAPDRRSRIASRWLSGMFSLHSNSGIIRMPRSVQHLSPA